MDEIGLVVKLGRRVRRFLHRLRREHGRVIAKDLAGGCAIGSQLFVEVASRCGLDAVFCYGHVDKTLAHAWAVVRHEGEDLYLVDVTATQFGAFPTVHITEPDDDMYAEDLRGEEALARVRRWAMSPRPARWQSPALHREAIEREIAALFGGRG